MTASIRGLTVVLLLIPSAVVWGGETDDVEARFRLGMEAVEAGQYQLAADAFEEVLAADPSHHRARLELARCYFHLESYDLARRDFRYVLGLDPPEIVRRNIQSFLDRIDDAERNSVFSGSLSAGIMWDSNVIPSPDSDRLDTPSGPILLDSDSRRDSDVSLFATLELKHRLRLFEGEGLWLKSSLLNYRSFHADRDDLDLNYLELGMGPSLQTDRLLATIRGIFTRLDRGYDRYSWSLGGDFAFTAVVAEHLLVLGNVTYEDREYTLEERDFATDTFSDAENLRAGVGPLLIWGAHRLVAQLGIERESARDRTQSYDRSRIVLRYEAELPYETTAYLGYDFRGDDYGSRDRTFGEIRREFIHQYSLGVEKNLGGDLSVGLGYTHTRSDSTLDLYDYRRGQLTFTLTWTF